MLSEALVSIIIPTYNRANLVIETIRSILQQTYSKYEIIVIDDGSTDNTKELIDQLNDSRIKYYWYENSGLPAVARNRGIRIARGEYLTFLDSDDLWVPLKLQKQVEFLKNNKDIFLVYSKCFIKKDGKIVGISPKRLYSGYVFEKLFLSYNFIPCLTVMMRNFADNEKYFFDEDIDLKAIEDYALWLKISYSKKIHYIDEPLATYVLHEENISSGAFPTLKRFKIVIDRFGGLVPKRMLFCKYISYHLKLLDAQLKHILSLIIRKPWSSILKNEIFDYR